MAGRRSHLGLALAGAVVIVAGFAVALVELWHLPRGTVWVVAAAAGLLVTAIRGLVR